MTPAEMGAKDGRAARERTFKRKRVFTPLGACSAAGNAFERLVIKGALTPEDIVEYGSAYVAAALGQSTEVE